MKIGSFTINIRQIAPFIGIILVVTLMMNLSSRLGELSHLQSQAATVRVQATNVMVTQEALQTMVAIVTSPAEVDAYARGEAHMGKPGDKVIVVLPAPGAMPLPTPTPIPASKKMTTWQVWIKFIFGE